MHRISRIYLKTPFYTIIILVFFASALQAQILRDNWAAVNHPPIANAGPDQTVYTESLSSALVSLDGSASSDPDGDALTYTWKLEESLPGGNGGSGIVIVKHSTSLSATGGMITFSGESAIHIFTSSGTFSCTGSGNVEVLVVAGGGGGGCHTGGGGGAGGVVYIASYPVTGNIPVIVGAGGAGSLDRYISGSIGSNSRFDSIIAIGGGGGASRFTYASNGGSGGGGSPAELGNSNGSGTSGQGFAGGVGGIYWNYLSGGGGGAGAVGSGGTGSGGNGNGGVGLAYSISGSYVYYGGGGGGGVYGTDVPGAGGIGGGGAGSNAYANVLNGTPNTGGGGGGGGLTAAIGNAYTTIGTGDHLTVMLPAGVQTIILSVDDGKGETSTDTVIVTVGRQISSPSPSIRVSTSLLSFGSVTVGNSKSTYLHMFNDGTDSSLIISTIVTSNTAFSVDRTSLTLAPLGWDSVLVTFLPPTKGIVFEDSLMITSNDAKKPHLKVFLSGLSSFSQPQIKFIQNLGGPIYAGVSILGNDIMYVIASHDAVYKMNTAGTIAYSLQVGGEIRSSSSIAFDTTVYIASSDKNLYAFSNYGNAVWPALPIGGELTATAAVDSEADRLYIGVSNHNFVAVNRASGLSSWSYFADAPISNSAVITQDRKVIFASQKGTLYGFDLNNLHSPASPTWQMALQDTAPGSLALDNQGFIYVGTGSGRLLKISMPKDEQPSIIWQVQTGSAITGSPVIDANGILYVGSLDSKFYAVDIQSGNVKWEFTSKAPIRSTPAISNTGFIYFGNDNGEVFALDSNKVVHWYYKTSSAIVAPLLYDQSTLYLGTLGNQVIALYDSAEIGNLSKSSTSVQVEKMPMWATFQGNNQRTGLAPSQRVTNVKDKSLEIPTVFSLSQNYPNPFNPSTIIRYGLPVKSFVRLQIFNVLGQVVHDLVNTVQDAGIQSVVWNTVISSGIYFYRINAVDATHPNNRFVNTKKMIFMK
jgi:outer membrane protein assembly factor BamB